MEFYSQLSFHVRITKFNAIGGITDLPYLLTWLLLFLGNCHPLSFPSEVVVLPKSAHAHGWAFLDTDLIFSTRNFVTHLLKIPSLSLCSVLFVRMLLTSTAFWVAFVHTCFIWKKYNTAVSQGFLLAHSVLIYFLYQPTSSRTKKKNHWKSVSLNPSNTTAIFGWETGKHN